MRRTPAGTTVLITDPGLATAITARLPHRYRPVTCYRALDELLTPERLAEVSVLVLRFPGLPLGILLPTMARLKYEYPDLQKAAVLRTPPPLPIAEYLTACEVDLLGEDADRLADAVQRMHERARWIAA